MSWKTEISWFRVEQTKDCEFTGKPLYRGISISRRWAWGRNLTHEGGLPHHAFSLGFLHFYWRTSIPS